MPLATTPTHKIVSLEPLTHRITDRVRILAREAAAQFQAAFTTSTNEEVRSMNKSKIATSE
jgi:hypothetical protein